MRTHFIQLCLLVAADVFLASCAAPDYQVVKHQFTVELRSGEHAEENGATVTVLQVDPRKQQALIRLAYGIGEGLVAEGWVAAGTFPALTPDTVQQKGIKLVKVKSDSAIIKFHWEDYEGIHPFFPNL